MQWVNYSFWTSSTGLLIRRPQNDPASPPFMMLVDASTDDESNPDCETMLNSSSSDSHCLSPPSQYRDRIHSADWQFSILGFLNRKIR
jgi:hypothetical protein